MSAGLDLEPVAPAVDSTALMFERLARDPAVDVTKLERLIAMQERILAHNAETAFNAAFVQLQAEIPTILELARTDKTAYAPLEDIIEAVRPLLRKHGFTLGFETRWPENKVHVTGILTHLQGHARRSEFLSAADNTGSKNAIQALGSSVAYGKRYTTKDLLCIVTRERDQRDDDGEGSEKAKEPDVPQGFEEWWMDLRSVADEGMTAFAKTWNDSRKDYRTFAAKHRNQALTAMKSQAAKVGKE